MLLDDHNLEFIKHIFWTLLVWKFPNEVIYISKE